MKKVFNSIIEEWFAASPRAWKTVKNRKLFYVSKSVVGENWGDYDLLSMGKPGVTIRDVESGKGKFPKSFDTYQVVEPGDLVFCLFDMNETPRTIGYSSLSGMITGAYTVVKTYKGVNPKFVYYLYMMIDEQKGLQPYYTGLRNSIRPDRFLDLEVKVPPIETQDAIVAALDEKIELIQKTIEIEKKRILELESLKYVILEDYVCGSAEA